MKKANLTIIATIIATIVISMFAFQPTTTEASNNVSPSATPSPRTKRPTTIRSPVIVKRTKVKSTTTFKSVSGLEVETERRKQPRKRKN